MGRDGGSDYQTFETKEEAEAFLSERKKYNDKDDSDDDNGDQSRFGSFKVVRESKTFSSVEEAMKKLEEMAEKADRGDNSIVFAVGSYNKPSLQVAEIKKKEIHAFSDSMDDLLSAPKGEKYFNVASNPEFVECRNCKSKLSRSWLLKKRIHDSNEYTTTINGICLVCDSETEKRRNFGEAITSNEWAELTGQCRYLSGSSLKRDRTLFNEEHTKDCEVQFEQAIALKESFKKRKKELDSSSDQIGYIVAWSWTSSHY